MTNSYRADCCFIVKFLLNFIKRFMILNINVKLLTKTKRPVDC